MSGISKRVSGSWVSGDYGIMKTATDTITTLPANLYADGNNATVGISGNTVQSGTPTPDNPIMPEGTGERTENLFDKDTATVYTAQINASTDDWEYINNARSVRIPCEANTTYTISVTTSISAFRVAETASSSVPDAETPVDIITIYSGVATSYSFTTSANAKYIIFQGARGSLDTWLSELMLNLGSTDLPYESYGYKIPISSASTTTPVYLGEVPTTRKIKKYEFTGQETIYSVTETLDTQGLYCFIYQYASLGMTDIIYNDSYMAAIPYPFFVSSHFINKSSDKRASFKNISVGEIGANSVTSGVQNSFLIMCVSGITSAAGFKQWLAAQYAAGTPVTVWYVLETETTGIVNEPIRKIGDYADTVSGITIPTIAGANSFDVLTTLKPSEVSLAYTGWHDATVKEWDGSEWQ